ncbi:MAG TPA: DUF4290 domain-containing protein [Chitinophagales bacterium]|nr:DUF4290 domain-containing protein [Chitinophagales bacterium]HRG29155.1 DUF4290 domain-containing protein [Chitinophagales bacterium]HRG87043.1 DUF4290 domain-containing protein [Chitinophagales bacterium]HRH53785.1 DUF4290 domain-containing protein [Chitinophagales bacterium]
MPYNTQLPKLILREYGRHIQQLVDFAVKIEDDEVRNKLVLDIIDMMGTMNPTLRNVEDFRHKLWDHIYMMSDFKLKANSPYPVPERETLMRKNIKLKYPKQKIRFAHYGKNIESCVNKASEIEDPAVKQEFAQVIGNYMKLVYQNWNRDNVNDLTIKQDLESLSNGKLQLDEDSDLDSLTKSTARRQENKPQQQNRNNNGGRNFQRHGQNKNYKNFKKNR